MSHYDSAKSHFADWGVDTETAITTLEAIPISMHCWQGDDVVGFEESSGTSGGGIQSTAISLVEHEHLTSCAPIWSSHFQ